jgi:hypothetical protein
MSILSKCKESIKNFLTNFYNKYICSEFPNSYPGFCFDCNNCNCANCKAIEAFNKGNDIDAYEIFSQNNKKII